MRETVGGLMSFRKEVEADLRLRLFLLLLVVLLGRPRSKWPDQVCAFAVKETSVSLKIQMIANDAKDGIGTCLDLINLSGKCQGYWRCYSLLQYHANLAC